MTENTTITCADISIRVFMLAMFNQQFEGVGGLDNWDKVYTEYIDLSGIGETRQFNLLTNIHNIQHRISQVQGFVDIEKKFFSVFNEPFQPALADLRKYGHRLTWDIGNPKQFIEQLERVEIKEKTRVAELDEMMKELEDLKSDGVKVDTNGRVEFVKQMNRLGKAGYNVDKDRTDMEAYALMIREYDEELQQRLLESEKNKHNG